MQRVKMLTIAVLFFAAGAATRMLKIKTINGTVSITPTTPLD
jgi:hypothetical protein